MMREGRDRFSLRAEREGGKGNFLPDQGREGSHLKGDAASLHTEEKHALSPL